MRDDLLKLFRNLLQFVKQKLKILNILSNNKSQKWSFLNTDKLDQLLDMMAEEENLLDQINSINFEIKELEREICEIAGIENNEFDTLILNIDEKTVIDLKNKRIKIDKIFKDQIADQDEFIVQMNEKLRELGRDVEALSFIKRIKNMDI